MRNSILAILTLICLAALPSAAESPYIFGWHFWRDGANIDCGGGGKAGWVTLLDVSTNFQPDVDVFKRIADEGHTIIMRVDWNGDSQFPTSSGDYWIHAARYAFWVEKLKDYCHIWIIGNEEPVNYECFKQVRRAIHAIQPHAILCVGDPSPGSEKIAMAALGDYIDGFVEHGPHTSWINEVDAAYPSAKTKPIYITEFGCCPPNPYNQLRQELAQVANHNATHPHKVEAACRFVYYEYGNEYASLQMQPMQDADFAEAAMLNSYTNSYAQPYIDVSGISVSSIDASTARITWTTDIGSTSQVEYWEDKEIDQHWSDFSGSETTTSHSRTIGPLVPGRTYHFYTRCYRSGRPLTYSAVQTFVHEPPTSGTVWGYVKTRDGSPVHGATVTRTPGGYSFTTDQAGRYEIRGCQEGTYSLACTAQTTNSVTRTNIAVAQGQTTQVDFLLTPKVNYLQNPGFESSLTGWTAFGHAPGVHTGPWFGEIRAHTGSKFAGVATNWGTPSGGIYQRVTGLPTGTYRFTVYSNLHHGDNPYNETKTRIGIDGTGGTDPAAFSVRWSAWDYNFWHWQSEWKQLVTPAVSSSGNCTVFIQYDDPTPQGWHIHAYDSAVLSSTALQTQTVATPAEAKSCEDGVPVVLAGVVATTDKGALGADILYVEDPDRTSGIKVVMTGVATAVSEGSTVTVTGAMATGPNGERFIQASSVQASPGAPLGPLGLTNRAIGGDGVAYEPGPPPSGQMGVKDGVGTSNIGLLVRTTGKVESAGSGWVMITDGSPTPLKVDVSRVTNEPSVESRVTITGIVSVEVSGPGLAPVLRARSNADIQPAQ